MAKSKNLRITSEEVKMLGTLNAEEELLVETEDGEVNLTDIIKEFDGAEIELLLKKKVEVNL